MSEVTYTHKDLARMLGVSETTIKSYRRKFPDSIPVANSGKPIRFTEQAGEICLYIRELFSRGMSVPEVGTRLAERFEWNPPKEEEKEQEPVVVTLPSEVALPEDYTMALSNLAKSMVELSMQQRNILKKVQSIDTRLDQLAEGNPLADRVTAASGESAAMPEAFNLWLSQAEAVLSRLESYAGEPQSNEGPQKKIVRVRNSYGEETEYQMETGSTAEGSDSGEATEPADSDMFAFEAEQGVHGDVDDSQQSSEQKGFIPKIVKFPSQQKAEPIYQDPPKVLSTLPLVVKTDEDEFIGVAGRSRGRFNIGDLKAVLMDNFFGDQRYHNHWEKTSNGWLLVLAQKDASREEQKNLAMLINQTKTPRGNDVALIQHLTINGHDDSVLEVPNFIKDIFER